MQLAYRFDKDKDGKISENDLNQILFPQIPKDQLTKSIKQIQQGFVKNRLSYQNAFKRHVRNDNGFVSF